jgi:hypothetical protein
MLEHQPRPSTEIRRVPNFLGADARTRTGDPFITSDAGRGAVTALEGGEGHPFACYRGIARHSRRRRMSSRGIPDVPVSFPAFRPAGMPVGPGRRRAVLRRRGHRVRIEGTTDCVEAERLGRPGARVRGSLAELRRPLAPRRASARAPGTMRRCRAARSRAAVRRPGSRRRDPPSGAARGAAVPSRARARCPSA